MTIFHNTPDGRRWRPSVVAAILLVAGSLVLGACGVFNSAVRGHAVAQTATALPSATMTQPTNTPTMTFTPTFTPTPTPDPCPFNPDMWSAVPIHPDGQGDVLKLSKLRPTCAYEGLMRSAAVFILMRSGYTYREAMQAVGWTVENEHVDMPQYTAYHVYVEGGFDISDPKMRYWSVYGTDNYRTWVYGEKSHRPVGRLYFYNCVKDYQVDDLLLQRTVTVPYACTFQIVYDEMPASFQQISFSEGEAWHIMPSAFNSEFAVKRGVPQDAVGYAEAFTFVYVGNGMWVPAGTPRFLPENRSPRPYKTELMRYFDTREEMDFYLGLLRGYDAEFWLNRVLDVDWVRQTYGVEPKPLNEEAFAGKQVYPNWSKEERAQRVRAVKEVLTPYLCRTIPVEEYCGQLPTPTPTPVR